MLHLHWVGVKKNLVILILTFTCFACERKAETSTESPVKPLTEFSNYYTQPKKETIYSKYVSDTLHLFKSTPEGYKNDSTQKYPLIILLDANAFFESTLSELKFNSFIGIVPRSIVIGVGYKDLVAMDSLRSRDYTYPVAIPEYEMTLSGKADMFKKFIDEELVPKLMKEYQVDMNRFVICGPSMGGYFTLFYALRSIEEDKYTIKNIVSASPSLHYNHRYLFEMEKGLTKPVHSVQLKVYVSMGSEDMADEESSD